MEGLVSGQAGMPIKAVAHGKARGKMLRYLVVGGFNTALAYLVSVGLYYALAHRLSLVVIALIANVLSITVSFATYRLFVFSSRGAWWRQYLRCYLVYGVNMLVGIAGLWLLVDVLGIAYWIAQAALMIVGIAISYTGHDRFTFQKTQGR